MAGEKLARLIKDQRIPHSDLADVLFGAVTSTSPLKIRVNPQLEIGADNIILSELVKEKIITITIDGKSGSATVFEALKSGDRVVMLRFSKGQKYYVLERG
ncbi:DUF2577 domain-containing protein [Enterococcus timonensis]|uniref:DUF2577 domain-containing protein n=1 Tax=Enterococcus timonensis TaxID=1852364 RepID=UPI0008DA4D31|nr:DUF2577 domain-containing protein [Enterococcus timonensis]